MKRAVMDEQVHQSTAKIDLPGGLDRLKQAILYVAARSSGAARLGGLKLGKVIWKADFDAYASRGVPVTGRPYQRLRSGPAPKEMLPVHREMIDAGLIKVQEVDFGNDVTERRTIAIALPDFALFTEDDILYLDRSISYYWDKTGLESSDASLGIAWLTRSDGETMPYEASLLSDRPPQAAQMQRLRQKIYDKGLQSE